MSHPQKSGGQDLLRALVSGMSPEDRETVRSMLAAGGAEVSSDDLVLEASSAPVPGKYREKIAHYAALYEQSDRTVKRWIGKGREKDDPPPLDDPVQMPVWFPRHHKHRVPERLIALAAEARDDTPVGTSEETPIAEPPPPVSYRPPSELPVGSGFEAELQRVRDEARKAAGVLADAEKSGVHADIDAARRQYDRALKLLREYERDAPKILAGMGNLVDRGVFEALLLTKHSAIRAEAEAMYTPDLHRALGSTLDYDVARRIHLAAFHHVLRYLTAGGFGDQEAFALEAAA